MARPTRSGSKLDSPLPGVLIAAAYVLVAFWAGAQWGVRVRPCPAFTADGRPHIGTNLRTNECRYAALPRPLADLPAKELFIMARAKARMEKVKPKGE